MRLVFFGSPQFAVPSLAALLDAGHEIALVVTQPDRPAGRGRHPTPPPVAAFAHEHGLPVWQTSSVRGASADERLRALNTDAMALAAFAALIPSNVLDLSRHGVLNVHPSLLPRWRGASPIHAALLAGDHDTGISIMRLVQALDAGPVLLQQRVPIALDDDYVTLELKLAQLGAELLVQALASVDSLEAREQNEAQATYCQRIEREDAHIDWSHSAETIWNQVRAYRAWPQAFSYWDGRLLKVLRARPVPWDGQAGRVEAIEREPVVGTGHGGLVLTEVVLAGRKPQSGAELLRGYAGLLGAHLS